MANGPPHKGEPANRTGPSYTRGAALSRSTTRESLAVSPPPHLKRPKEDRNIRNDSGRLRSKTAPFPASRSKTCLFYTSC